MTFATGARLGPYEVLSRLGAGGMGEVWRARDARLNREVAIKILPAELGSDAGRLKRFEKDARSIRNDGEPLLAPRFRQSVIEGHERKLCRSVFGGNEQGSELQCIRGPQRVNTQ